MHPSMRAIVIYESLTGNTKRAAELMAAELNQAGVVTTASPITRIDYQALAEADIVIVGTWTDGILVVGQRPGRAGRIRQLPTMLGKRCVVFCTYAIDPGKTLHKLTAILQERGADVIGGVAIKRQRLEQGVHDLVERLLDEVPAA